MVARDQQLFAVFRTFYDISQRFIRARCQVGLPRGKVKLHHAVFNLDAGRVSSVLRRIGRRQRRRGRSHSSCCYRSFRRSIHLAALVNANTHHQRNHQSDQAKHHPQHQALLAVIILRRHRNTFY